MPASHAIVEQRSRNAIRFLSWFSVSLATALVAHAAIDLLASASRGHAHERYAHPAVVPLLFVAGVLGSASALWSAMRRMRGAGADPLLAVAREFETAYPVLCCIAVAAGGIAWLVAMECCEQFAGLGYVEGIGDALGGNVAFGLATVASIGSLATLIGLRCAHAMVATAAATIDFALSWFVEVSRFAADRASIMRCRPQRNAVRASARITRSFGLRAPPASLR